MHVNKQFKRCLVFLLLLTIQQTISSQVEYRLTASLFGDYFFGGEEKHTEINSINYKMEGMTGGYGIGLAYNVSNNISVNSRLFAGGGNPSEYDIFYYCTQLSLGVNYYFGKSWRLSPYLYLNGSYIFSYFHAPRKIKIGSSGNQYQTIGNKYSAESKGLGYMGGGGLRFKMNLKWSLYLQAGYYSDPFCESYNAEMGIQFNFLTKKH